MNEQDITRIEQQLAEQDVKVNHLLNQSQDLMIKFQAAALQNDAVEADKYRGQIHDTMDLLLDSLSIVQLIHRELINKKKGKI